MRASSEQQAAGSEQREASSEQQARGACHPELAEPRGGEAQRRTLDALATNACHPEPAAPAERAERGEGSPVTSEPREEVAAAPQLRRLGMTVAALLRYPQGQLVREGDDNEELSAFFDEVAHVDATGLEELYTTTFDLNPVATLEIGWHLWGEQYERGRFLADLRGLQESLGIDATTELPDHLTILLPTIAAAPDDIARDLAGKCVAGIDKIRAPLEQHGNPYRHVLRAARAWCDSVRPPVESLLPASRGEGGRRPDEGSLFAQAKDPSPPLRGPSPRAAGRGGSNVDASSGPGAPLTGVLA